MCIKEEVLGTLVGPEADGQKKPSARMHDYRVCPDLLVACELAVLLRSTPADSGRSLLAS